MELYIRATITTMNLLTNIVSRVTVTRYYKMSDARLEAEASKFNIKQYGDPQSGNVMREIIIRQLVMKDKANDSRVAVAVSIGALIVSIIALVVAS